MNNRPHCLMPFIHFHVSNKGVAKACCVANIPFGNINEESMEEIWNGEQIQSLRERFLKGQIDNRCAVCHRLEAAGADSIRLETFRKFDYRAIDEKPKQPIYFDIRFSNVCNFRCRTCWHGASSKWFKDAKALGTNLGESAILNNINDLDDFIAKTGTALLSAEEFYFAGGEPLVTEAHYLLLDWLVKQKATSARLRYNTNFSKLTFKSYQALEYWQHFPKVELLASIDASEDLGEYIRKEMKWSDIIENREQIRALPHIDFKIAPTVSVMNVLHLPDLYEQCLALNMIEVTDLYINILERPVHYNIQILPEDKKAKVIERYTEFFKQDLPESIRRSFQDILDYMLAEDRSKFWPKFLVETERLDLLRGEKGGEYPISNKE